MRYIDFIKSDLANQPHFLLIGNPVSHSVSPIMHNTAIKQHDIEATYYAVSIDESDLSNLASHLNKDAFLGANITIPHKMKLIPFMDHLSKSAQEIGAINTIVKKDGTLIGENTDAHGFLVPLKDLGEIENDRAIIFGSGGATKAIIYALNDFGFEEVYMVSRRPELIGEQSGCIVCSYDDWQYFSEDASVIINATPLGMVPKIDSSPVRDNEIEYLASKICYDIVYNPRETKFLRQAKEVNAVPVGGLDMLIHQGDESFFKWTGQRFPIGLVRMKLDEHFAI